MVDTRVGTRVDTRATIRTDAIFSFGSAAVLFLHFAAVLFYIFYYRYGGHEGFWGAWALQASVLIVSSAVLFAAAALMQSGSSRTFVIALQFLLHLVGVYGEASFPLPLFAWGTALMAEVHLFFRLPKAAAFSIGMAVLAVFLPRTESAWDFKINPMGWEDRLAAAGYYSVVVFLIFAYRRLILQSESDRQSKALLQESLIRLMSANLGFQHYAVSAERKAAEEERHRITREIHDTIGYTLTNLIMMTKASEELIDNNHDLLRELLSEARTQCRESLAETRHTLRSLWAMKIPEMTFSNHLWKTVRVFEMATGIDVQLEFQNLPQILSSTARDILHRTLQEGLTNSFRHGRASRVTVSFWYDGSGVSIAIQDNGVGNPKFQEDIGIGGIRERFESVNGQVTVQSPRGGGFEIRAWLPMKENRKETE